MPFGFALPATSFSLRSVPVGLTSTGHGTPSGTRLGLLILLCCAIAPASAPAAPSVQAADSQTYVEAGFELPGTHGYAIRGYAYAEGNGPRGSLTLVVTRAGEAASYGVPARVTAGGIRADLGPLGRVDLVRRGSGRMDSVRPKCLGGSFAYEPAALEGVFEFSGEGAYTHATANRLEQVPPVLLLAGDGPCGSGSGESTGGESLPGARLKGFSLAGGRSLAFQVNKNSPRARTLFKATLKERRGPLRISREVTGSAGPGAFRFDKRLRSARLSPPAPFSGSGSISRSRTSVPPVWTGGLKLDFPGRPRVRLAGPGIYATLVHARFSSNDGPRAEAGF